MLIARQSSLSHPGRTRVKPMALIFASIKRRVSGGWLRPGLTRARRDMAEPIADAIDEDLRQHPDGAMAAHVMGDGWHPIRHDDVVFDADPDHAVVSAGARRAIGERHRFMGRHPRRCYVICRGFRLAVVGTAGRPPRAQIDAAAVERRDRVVCRADGRSGQCLAAVRVPRADGCVRRVFEHRDCSRCGPSSRRASRICARLAQHRPACRLAGRAVAWRRVGRSDRQLSDSVLLHLGNHPVVDVFCVVWRA